jgi:hypothetical protein
MVSNALNQRRHTDGHHQRVAAISRRRRRTVLLSRRTPHSQGAASIVGISLDLRDTGIGLDVRNIQRLIASINHAFGWRAGNTG